MSESGGHLENNDPFKETFSTLPDLLHSMYNNIDRSKTDHCSENQIKTSALNELQKQLECQGCQQVCESPPLFKCPFEHLLCQSCYSLAPRCPLCGERLADVKSDRNAFAEMLTEKLARLDLCSWDDTNFEVSLAEGDRGLFSPKVFV